ncbi:LOW QUALITY PROTEIN: olfactory receptor 2A5-like [Rhynochetos jubatus]
MVQSLAHIPEGFSPPAGVPEEEGVHEAPSCSSAPALPVTLSLGLAAAPSPPCSRSHPGCWAPGPIHSPALNLRVVEHIPSMLPRFSLEGCEHEANTYGAVFANGHLYESLKRGNLSSPTMFLLLGFSSAYRAQVALCLCLSLVYLLMVLGNLLIVTLVWLDSHLHSPMYFFLGHLSFLDICYSSVTLPKILRDSFSPQKTISFVGCIMQIYFFLCFGASECVLLAAMAYDRYLAIHPLHYPALMSRKMCHCLVAILWLSSSFSSLIQAFLTARLPFCGSNMINSLFCEIPFFLRASCSPNAPLNKVILYALTWTIAMGSFLLTLVSYVHIIRAVLQKGAGMQRAFATCTSHLTMVSLFFGAGAIAYLVPHSGSAKEMDKVLALLYAVVTLMLNPIIYSLGNSRVEAAIRTALHRGVLQMSTNVGTQGLGTYFKHHLSLCLKAPSTAGWNLHCQLQKAQLIRYGPRQASCASPLEEPVSGVKVIPENGELLPQAKWWQ